MFNRSKPANAGQALVVAIVGLFALLIVIVIAVAVMTSRAGSSHDTGGNVGGYPDCDRGDQIEHDTDCGYTSSEHKRCKKLLKAKKQCVGGNAGRKKASFFQKLKQKRAAKAAQKHRQKALENRRKSSSSSGSSGSSRSRSSSGSRSSRKR